MLSAAESSCSAGALGRAQAELDEAAAYRDDQRHLGLAQRVQSRIHHALRQPAKATSALLAAARSLGPVDVRLARDILVEAIVEAQINGPLAAACADATLLADEPRLHELTRRMEAAAREQGAMVPLSLALSYAGVSGLLAGDLPEAERCFTEITAIAEARGQPWAVGSLILSAWRGQADRAYALLDAVADAADRQGQGYQLVFADYARCILELGHGHYGAAYASSRVDDTSQIKFVLPDLVEAAQRSGHPDAAARLVRLLAKLATGQPGPVTLGFLARAQALVAGDGADADAEEHYREAINQHGRAQAHLARSHLVYGEWLRRVKRPRDARASLRTALRLFDEIGAQGFARRARRELAAAGETVVAQVSAGPRRDLTPQEAQVARLAAAGATNAEIAAQLYLSPNTVDYHLRKVFRKLDVTSRRQLARAQLAILEELN